MDQHIVVYYFHFVLINRVVNEPLESISHDLGFSGNTLAEGESSGFLGFASHPAAPPLFFLGWGLLIYGDIFNGY